MRLMIDNHHGSSVLEVLTENAADGRKLYLEGPMVMCGQNNRNKRFYDKNTVGIPAVERYNREYILDGRAIGEVEHPNYPFPKLSEAATMINEPMSWVGDNAVGKMMILNNPKGQVIRSLVEANYNMGVSTRGLGDTRKSGDVDHVKPGYVITAVDTVDRPSGQTCYVKAITESVDWEEVNGVWVPVGTNENIDKVLKENCDDGEFLRRFKLTLEKLG